MKENAAVFSELIELFQDDPIDYIYTQPIVMVGGGKNQISNIPSAEDYINLIIETAEAINKKIEKFQPKKIQIEIPQYFAEEIRKFYPFDGIVFEGKKSIIKLILTVHRCSLFSFNEIAISPYGDFTGCCKMSPTIGTYRGNILNIAKSKNVEKYRSIISKSRKQFYDDIILNENFVCHNCNKFSSCLGGCRATTYTAAGGGLLAPDPRCPTGMKNKGEEIKCTTLEIRKRLRALMKNYRIYSMSYHNEVPFWGGV
jgi:radical SAM protein with 4Fe4S-binding SPASM domain